MVTLGMLHDIAKTIMRNHYPGRHRLFPDPRERLRQENELYGIDHASTRGDTWHEDGKCPKG